MRHLDPKDSNRERKRRKEGSELRSAAGLWLEWCVWSVTKQKRKELVAARTPSFKSFHSVMPDVLSPSCEEALARRAAAPTADALMEPRGSTTEPMAR